MEVPNYINNKPIYGPVTNGPAVTNGQLGSGLLGTAAATLKRFPSNANPSTISPVYPSIIDTYVSENVSNYLQAIETLKEENEALKNKVELLEIQYKFLLKKFNEVEKFMENKK